MSSSWLIWVTVLINAFLIALFGSIIVLTRLGHLPRNSFYGIRTGATLASDQAWQAGHQAAQPALLTLCGMHVAATVTGVLAAVTGHLSLAYAVVVAAMALDLVGAVWLVVVANRAAKATL